MASLTAKQESFIAWMRDSPELARRGFDILLRRADFESFFDALKDADLFDPARHPLPVEVEPPGSFQVPYWSALDYLKAVAALAGERSDPALAGKVMEVVRSVNPGSHLS